MSVKKTVDPQDLLSASEAAAMLPDTGAQTVLRWARRGLIPFVELPGGGRQRKYFRREDIEALLEPRVASASRPGSSPDDAAALPGQGALL